MQTAKTLGESSQTLNRQSPTKSPIFTIDNKDEPLILPMGCYDSSSSSESESDIEDSVKSDRDMIRDWALSCKISHASLSGLLKILRILGHKSLPSDARTLLKTPKTIKTDVVLPGEYWHAGLEKALKPIFWRVQAK